jgi:hypothetical protein
MKCATWNKRNLVQIADYYTSTPDLMDVRPHSLTFDDDDDDDHDHDHDDGNKYFHGVPFRRSRDSVVGIATG